MSIEQQRRLPDQDDRDTIVRDLGRSFLVEAAAGTGKTTSLVARMTSLLRAGITTADHIAAMTFTVKAAGHLRQKFEESLTAALAAETDPVVRSRLAAAVEQIDGASIGTIHSFCAVLLRERPVEAGLDPGFAVIEEEEEHTLRGAVLQDWLRGLHEQDPALFDWLQRMHIDAAVVEDAYTNLCANPDVSFHGAAPDAPDFSGALDALGPFIERTVNAVPAVPPEKGFDRLQTALTRAARWLAALGDEPAEAASFLQPFEAGEALVTLNRWDATGLDAKRVKEDIEQIAEAFIRPALRHWRAFLYPIILDAAEAAHERYAAEKLRRGLLSNNDLLLKTRDMLRDHPAVRKELQQRFTHVLVDEFQDTDPVQAEIMLYLTGEDTEERQWDALRPRPGSLFVVGDPKQSIYRFRRADIGVYNRVAALITQSGGGVLRLVSSFRSAAPLCAWVNARFDGTVFPTDATPYQAAAASLEATRSRGGDLCGAYAFPIMYEDLRRSGAMLEAEARAIARWAAAAIAANTEIMVVEDRREVVRPLRAGDILLLTTGNRVINAFAAAFEAEGLAVTLSGGHAFREHEDIAPVMHLLRALADPLDEISVVAFLRGPYCGADDAALAQYSAAGGRFTFFSSVIKEGDRRILDGLAFIKGRVRLLRSFPPAAVVGSMFEELGLLAYVGAQERGNMRAGTLQRLLQFVQRASARGASFAEIVQQLETACERSRIEGMPLLPAKDAVRIMNLHKAKGLEAPVVVLARSGGAGRGSISLSTDRSQHPPTGAMTMQRRFNNHAATLVARPADWDDTEAEEQRFLDAERLRLQYVAATRAQCAVVVSLRANPSKSPETWDALSDGLENEVPHVPAVAPPPVAEGTAVPDPREAARTIEHLRERAAAAGYHVVTPSSLSEHAAGGGEGRGAAFGSAAHRLLEQALRRDIGSGAELAVRFARDAGLDGEAARHLCALLETVRTHALWDEILQAETVLTEVPFGYASSPSSSDVVRGDIDVAFRNGGGWTIVDFKTDTADDVEARAKGYLPQVAAYREAWKTITGEDARTLLWFVSTGQVFNAAAL